jgi:hypothetical protein
LITTATRIPGLETANKIRRFLKYPNGWHFGAGAPPSLDRVRDALILNNAAAKAGLDTNAFLGTEGEVRVTVYLGGTYLQFTLEDDNFVEYVREDREVETVRTPRLRLVDALSILDTFENELCLSSVSSTATTTIRSKDTSKTLPSRPLDAEWAFLWSSGTALPT